MRGVGVNWKVWVSGGWLVFMCILFFAGPYIGLRPPTEMNSADSFHGPSQEYLFGTDNFGRDVFSRVAHGGRVSLGVGLSSTLFALVIGGVLGLVAGYFGGTLGYWIMRVMDFLIAFPPILLAVFVVGLLGGSMGNLILVIGILYVPRIARVARGQCLREKANAYVESMRSIGSTHLRVMFKGIVPNSIGPVIVQASIIFAYALLLESGLSFLGLGVQPPTPTLGGMINEGRAYMHLSIHPILWPSVFLSLLVLSGNMFSEGMRELLDPTLR